MSTLCQEMEKSSDPKGWIRGNTKIGPVLEVTTSYLQGKYGVEIGIEYINKDKSHSWVRIFHGLNKLVTDLTATRRTTTTSRRPLKRRRKYLLLQADQRLKQNREDLPLLAHLQGLYLFLKEHGLIFEPGAQFDQAYPVARRLNTLLRHGELTREEDGAIEFWRLKDDLRNELEHSQYWSDDVWKSKMAGGGGNKKIFQSCTDPSGQEIPYLRALKVIQDAIPLILHCRTMC